MIPFVFAEKLPGDRCAPRTNVLERHVILRREEIVRDQIGNGIVDLKDSQPSFGFQQISDERKRERWECFDLSLDFMQFRSEFSTLIERGQITAPIVD